jgi:NAD(P)-dependent dehydrogenase (short-subunit alcohol dehydrogenase family)
MPAAILTGADSGIGRAGAVILAERGWDLGITYLSDEDGAREVAAEVEGLGRRCLIAQLDVSDFDRVQPVLEEMIEALGGIELFVNNAGTGDMTPFVDLALEDWQKVLDVDLTGAFLAAQAAARHMVEAGVEGAIVNVTSVHEHVPLRESAAYCAAKGGLGLLTKVMALELAEHGIRVNSLAPGEISTPMTGQEDEDPRDQERPQIPGGRPGHAREIGEWIAFLGSGAARYATGQSYVVDGGLLLMAAIANQDANA